MFSPDSAAAAAVTAVLLLSIHSDPTHGFAAETLPEDERRHLVKVLSHSLNAGEVEFSPEWKAEVGRRIADVESGAVKPVPWDEVETRIKGVLGAP